MEARAIDPDERGRSLANLVDLVVPLLEARGARSVIEVGAYAGELTEKLVRWAATAGAEVVAVDPELPQPLREVKRRHPELELVGETSHQALGHLPLADAVIIDGDHNYYTVSEELRLIESRAEGVELPLLLFHDVGWPHARRDTYWAPEQIPSEHRQPIAHEVEIAPDEPGTVEVGLHFHSAAAREGGPRNGVLTAIEDFIEERDGLRLAIVPAFFGFGLLWPEAAPWAGAVAAVIAPWDRNAVIERMEAGRLTHLIGLLEQERQLERERRRGAQLERLAGNMLDSPEFAFAERVSRLRYGGRPTFSRKQLREALEEESGPPIPGRGSAGRPA